LGLEKGILSVERGILSDKGVWRSGIFAFCPGGFGGRRRKAFVGKGLHVVDWREIRLGSTKWVHSVGWPNS
jgi:hypothetical protein